MRKHHHGFSINRRSGRRHQNFDTHKKSPWFSEIIARRGPRIERGEIRYLILDTLKEKGRHGYDIMQIIQKKTNGMYRPSSGTVYPALQILEDIELITLRTEGKRKIYELTETGRQALESHQSLLEDIYEDMDHGQFPEQDEFFEETHLLFSRMFKSISRSFQRGGLGTEKVERIRQIIMETVQKVDKVLKS